MSHDDSLPIWALRRLAWPLEAGLVWGLYGLASILPVGFASWMMAGLFRLVGPLTPWHGRALFNIGLALPQTTAVERQRIARAAWANIGALVGEYPHTARLHRHGRIEYRGLEHLQALEGSGGFLLGGHLANWELFTMPAIAVGRRASVIYRPTNNPLVNRLFLGRLNRTAAIFPKGQAGARGISAAVRRGELAGMLVDQKLREGMMLPFFGHPASTAIAHARMALRWQLPILMVRVERRTGCRFVISLEPLDLCCHDGSDDAQVAALASRINSILEHWIRDRPEQWFWFHRRWPQSKGEDAS